jgi:hypothetical protein
VLKTILDLELDLTELEVAGEELEAKVDAAMQENPELRDYVDQLDIVEEPAPEPGVEELMADLPITRPDPADVMRELEEILRLRRPDSEQERPPESRN